MNRDHTGFYMFRTTTQKDHQSSLSSSSGCGTGCSDGQQQQRQFHSDTAPLNNHYYSQPIRVIPLIQNQARGTTNTTTRTSESNNLELNQYCPHTPTQQPCSTWEIDLIVSHVLGYLTWKEQLNCQSVSKLWKEAYSSAPIPLLILLLDEHQRIPLVLQPCQHDRQYNQITWNALVRLLLLDRAHGGTSRKRISRLDIYGSGRTSTPSTITTILNALHKIQSGTNNHTVDIDEVRLLHVPDEVFSKSHPYPHPASPLSSSITMTTTWTSTLLWWSSCLFSRVKRLVIRRLPPRPPSHGSEIIQSRPPSRGSTTVMIHQLSLQQEETLSYLRHHLAPNLQVLDMDGTVFHLE